MKEIAYQKDFSEQKFVYLACLILRINSHSKQLKILAVFFRTKIISQTCANFTIIVGGIRY